MFEQNMTVTTLFTNLTFFCPYLTSSKLRKCDIRCRNGNHNMRALAHFHTRLTKQSRRHKQGDFRVDLDYQNIRLLIKSQRHTNVLSCLCT